MASSSDNESDNSAEEIAAPTRRTRSGRGTAAKPARRGRRRGAGATSARSTRNTRKSQRVQQEEEELDEMLDQGQSSEPDDLVGLPSSEDPLQFEGGTVEPAFADQFNMEDTNGVQNEGQTKSDDSGQDSSDEEQSQKEQQQEDSPKREESPPQEEDSMDQETSQPIEENSPEPAAGQAQEQDSPEEERSQTHVDNSPEQQEQSEDMEMTDTAAADSASQSPVQNAASTIIVQQEAMQVDEATTEVSTNKGKPKEKEDAKTAEVSIGKEETEVTEKIKKAADEEPETKGKGELEKKRKRRGFSDTPIQDFAPPAKKAVKDEPTVNGEGKDDGDSSPEQQGDDKAARRRKTLPELEKYWKAVKEDSSDFTGWTYLLQYVDQETDVEAAREAYDAFLSLYPYCYGYWRKYADYEKKKGSPDNCDKQAETTELSSCSRTTLRTINAKEIYINL